MSKNLKKSTLTLMEAPENGLVHAYGMPLLKSTKPSCVKQVQSLKENAKWLSPDRNFLNSNPICKEKIIKKSKPVKSDCVCHENVETSSNASRSKPRRRRYAKLDLIDSNSKCFDNDENKENIQPGAINKALSSSNHLNSEKVNQNRQKHFSDSSNFTNFV